MTRQTLSLDGQWQFWTDPSAALSPKKLNPKAALKVAVPAPWQTHADLRNYAGVGWYQRTVTVPAKMLKDKALILRFGAVDNLATVWVNGKQVGQHEGGYLPFELDITKIAKAGANTITVRAADTLDQFPEVPHGKQSWYGHISGMWQSVQIESRAPKHITAVKATPNGEDVSVSVSTNRPLTSRDEVLVSILSPKGAVVASGTADNGAITLRVPNPALWDIDTPNLYTVQAVLNKTDIVGDNFGFRTIEARDGKLWLNGRPVYMRSALDQDYYPDAIYTPPSQDYIEQQFRQAKELGLNSLRIHIKIGDPRYYAAADKVGLLIWTEMPNWQILTDETKRRAKATFEGMVERDWNRPSIIIRSVINEAWGIDQYDSNHLKWMADSYDWLKALDPARLVVDNSPCHSNYHVVTDIDDMHVYYTIPDHYQEFRKWTNTYAGRPGWTFAPDLQTVEEKQRFRRDQWNADWITPHPLVRRRGDEPLIVSEFGNWGLPDIDRLEAYYKGEPWWFNTGLEHGEGQVYPHGVRERFELFHLNRAFTSLSALSKASQEMQHLAMKFELEEMRSHSSIQGYVITEFTDLHWECNGLLDMVRGQKSYHKLFGQINADDVIVPKWSRVAYWEGEQVDIGLAVSQYSQRDLSGSRIEWSVPGEKISGSTGALNPVQADVIDAGALSFTVPATKTSAKVRLELKLVTAQGKVAARNFVDLYFFPRQSARAATNARVFAGEHAAALTELGYNVVGSMEDAEVVVATAMTEPLRQYLLEGGRVAWLAEAAGTQQTPLTGINGAHVAPREGTPWTGDWASNFNWLCQDKWFKDIPTQGKVDFAFADLTPSNVIHGPHPFHYAKDVHSGLFLGWIQKAVALMSERTVGKGKVFINTYRIGAHLTTHPVAAILLRDSVRSALA